ncbi:hypothetical protein BH11ACT3_BH11ACT3_02030 [soil metagenome]
MKTSPEAAGRFDGRRIAIAGVLAALLASAIATVPAQSASAVPALFVFASPTGSGTTCSAVAPCSLSGAQAKVRTLNGSMSGDITVSLASGTYPLSTPLAFTSADSASGGHRITWQAGANQTPVFSGGTKLSSWTLFDAAKNIWKATLPSGQTARELWVDGARAATSTGGSLPGSSSQTSTGYSHPISATLTSLSNPAGLEFQYSPGNWVFDVCGVASVTTTAVVMDEPCYSTARAWQWGSIGYPSAVTNAREFINGPGQVAFDDAAGLVYYSPTSTQNLATADAEVGNASTVLTLAGTSSAPVSGLSFAGITFAYTSWSAVSGGNGFAAPQADIVFPSNGCATNWNSSTYVFPTGGASADGLPYGSCAVTMPAAVSVHAGRNLIFAGNVFQHTGTAALTLDGGSQQSSVTGNTFTDIGGNGVQIGSVTTPNQSNSQLVDAYITVDNNTITGAANEYYGGVAVWAGYVAHVTIAHNVIVDSPYSGISVGWGWGSLDTKPSIDTDNHIVGNLIQTFKTRRSDGGAIYTLGPQPNGLISGNYVQNDGGYAGSIYLDGGTTGLTVTENVETGINAFFQNVSNTWDTPVDTVTGNFVTTLSCVCGSSNVSNNTVVANKAWPTAARAIMADAGLQPSYRSRLLEAEGAALSGGATTNSTDAGSTGVGYAEGLASVGASIGFRVTAPQAGSQTLTVRYANGTGASEFLSLYLNGVKAKQVAFPTLPSWASWSTQSVAVNLAAGDNTVTFQHDAADTGGVHLDNLTVPIYEAERITPVAGRPLVFADRSASGGLAVQLLETVGDGLQLTTPAAAGSLSVRYATPNSGTYSLYVNGTKTQTIPITSTGGWNGTYATTTAAVTIPANATVSLQNDAGDTGINVDWVSLGSATAPSPTTVQAESATRIGRAAIFSDGAASGGQAVQQLDTAGDGIQFSNAPAASQLSLTYATPSTGTYSVYVNGTKTATITVGSIGVWNGAYLTSSYPISIPAGATLKLQHDSGDTGINLDYITLSPAPPTTVQAESVTRIGRAAIFSDGAASGGQAVQQLDTAGDGIQFSNVLAATQLSLTYATPTTGTYSVYINGTKVATITVGSTGVWTGKYLTSVYPITIPNGATLKLQHDTGDTGINLDYIGLQ